VKVRVPWVPASGLNPVPPPARTDLREQEAGAVLVYRVDKTRSTGT